MKADCPTVVRDRPGVSRFYTLGYEGRDRAGNTAACTTIVTVPHETVRQH